MHLNRPRVYANATALIGLARINRLDLLTLLHNPIYVTAHVWEEVTGDREKPGVETILETHSSGLLEVVDEGNPRAFPQLDSGESTVISAAATARATVLIDERRARSLINNTPELRNAIVHVTGIIGLILLAKDRDYIPSVQPLLDGLLLQGFRLSPKLYRDILNAAGEQ